MDGFADLLRRFGPLWVAAAVPGPHSGVVTGVIVGRTPQTTQVFINDPWEQGMKVFRWPNRGAKYTRSYVQFTHQMETLGRQEMSQPAPIYVAHLP